MPAPTHHLSEKEQIGMWLLRLCALHPNMNLTPSLVETYWDALSDLMPDEIDLAFGEAIKQIKFWPKPAEIRGCLGPVPDNDGLGGFPVCAGRCGHTRAFHKPENAGRRNSRGIVYDGHKWEDRERS